MIWFLVLPKFGPLSPFSLKVCFHLLLLVYILFIYVRIEEALSSCSASTGDIISTTERLQQELEVITQRQEIVSCFLRDYQLSNEEVHFLSKQN